jgi:hypothetical protein
MYVSSQVHDSPRHYGDASIDREGPFVRVAPELARMPTSAINGVIAHELGHILVLLKIEPMKQGHDAAERQADRVAEKVFGKKIYYDRVDQVQRMGQGARGVRPRPKGLK